ncbi:MAG: hypothetical protein K0S08_1939 [Gammaproteobacteria bacterium]|jgi:uncharacterized SAM-binding protein YcdF (DUF218 family)|nr:hypothetical protein [Gammaproteobacteria bacterium]
MLNLCIFFFLIVSYLFLIAKRCFGITALVLALFVYWMSSSGVFTQWLAQSLQSSYRQPTGIQWQNSNAIVLLGAGEEKLPGTDQVEPLSIAYARIFEAVKLYENCKSSQRICKIITSGGDPLNTGKTEADVYAQKLIMLGVNPQDILLESNSKNTYQNALFTKQLLQQVCLANVALVTSAWHMRRAVLFFHQAGVLVSPAVSDYFVAKAGIIPSSYNLILTDLMLHEYLGIVQFHLYNFMGWNKVVSAAVKCELKNIS